MAKSEKMKFWRLKADLFNSEMERDSFGNLYLSLSF